MRADAVNVVGTPLVSHALYGVFETGDEVFVVRLRFDRAFAFPVELLIPHRDDLKNHRPAWALVGPGLPPPSAEELAALPGGLPAGAGAWVDLHRNSPRPVFWEPFTRRYFWGSGTVALSVPPGEFEFRIWSPARTRGKVVLGFGVEEGGDFTKAFDDWCLYAY